MKFHQIEYPIAYTGAELVNHWIYKNVGMVGDAVVSFTGPCEVDPAKMVDLEDVLNDDFIYSRQMLHFIIEIFGLPLREGVLIQRLFSSILQGQLNAMLSAMLSAGGTGGNSYRVTRSGDDLFVDGTKKLSVSICTVSPTSILIHAGFNIDPTGAPVEAAGLATDLGLSTSQIQQLATVCMKTLAKEWHDVKLACCKVRAVS